MAQQAIRSLLDVGNAMGLQFSQDAYDAGIHTSPISVSFPAYPITASIHLSDFTFDELLMAVLLQACIGGSANMFRVQRLTSYCFKFFVPSTSSIDLLLRQPPSKAKHFTLLFDSFLCAPKEDPCDIPRSIGSCLMHGPVTNAQQRPPQTPSVLPSTVTAATSMYVASAPSTSYAPQAITDGAPPGARSARFRSAKVSRFRVGAIFRSYILQNYHSDVAHSLFSTSQNIPNCIFWICSISAKIKPSVHLVKNALDNLLASDDQFTVNHCHGPLVTSTVASVNVLSEIMLISPFKLPGIKFHIFNKFELISAAVPKFK
jgi:hypothetical protein